MGLIYLIFQTQNAMVDSWYYAACVKFNTEIFNSHHLLYNLAGYYWFNLLKAASPSIEAIAVLNVLNALAATACLYLVYYCLLKLKSNQTNAVWLSVFCGVSFGFMRYATDAETYILPIAFSLASTYFFIKENSPYKLILSGIFASIAILFHQVHLWWSLAIACGIISSKPFNIKGFLAFSGPLLLVPLVYWIVFKQSVLNTTFLEFITGEYSKGNAGIDLSFKAFQLTIINILRSFFQVHGNILLITKHFLSFVIISLMVVLFLSFKGFSTLKFKFNVLSNNKHSQFVFKMAIFFHILFAFFSSGNAEFMVMLPFLLVLWLASAFQSENLPAIKYFTLALFIWNFSFAILPNATLNLTMVEKQSTISIQNENAYTLWQNKPLVENNITYKKGFKYTNQRFLDHKKITKNTLDSLLEYKVMIYTDLPNSNKVYDREKWVSKSNNSDLISNYLLKRCDSFDNIYGKNYIYTIQKRTD